MCRNEPERDYFQWLLDVIHIGEFPYCNYRMVLRQLFDTEFTFSSEKDASRAYEGVELRSYFLDDEPNGVMREGDFGRGCSVLELMIGMADSCERKIMYNPRYGDRTHIWFWEMMKSLGLQAYPDSFYNREAVNAILVRFATKTYKRNGEGGLFRISHSRKDMRLMDLWSQMNYWLNENYSFNL